MTVTFIVCAGDLGGDTTNIHTQSYMTVTFIVCVGDLDGDGVAGDAVEVMWDWTKKREIYKTK